LLGKKDDDGEDNPFMEECFQDKDKKKKKTHFDLWIIQFIFILIIGVLVTTLTILFLRRINLWEVNL
jgi:heme/copper-type cytochrome/quinol oxidase subunit 2